MLSPDALTSEVARELLGMPDITRDVRVVLLRRENHTWRVSVEDSTWYVKAHTKSWYGGDPEAAAGAVQHEASAHRILADAGLPTPVVVTAAATDENPLGWPYLLTEELPGTSRAKHCLATSSCTTALYLAAQCLGVRPGDEVSSQHKRSG